MNNDSHQFLTLKLNTEKQTDSHCSPLHRHTTHTLWSPTLDLDMTYSMFPDGGESSFGSLSGLLVMIGEPLPSLCNWSVPWKSWHCVNKCPLSQSEDWGLIRVCSESSTPKVEVEKTLCSNSSAWVGICIRIHYSSWYVDAGCHWVVKSGSMSPSTAFLLCPHMTAPWAMSNL